MRGAYIEAMNANPDIWQKAYEGACNHSVAHSPRDRSAPCGADVAERDRTVNSEKIAATGQKMIDSVQAFLEGYGRLGQINRQEPTDILIGLKRLTTGNNNVLEWPRI